MIGSARNEGGAVKLGLPKGQDVVRLMNHEMQRRGQGDQVIRIYWAVSPVALEGVMDQIRTRLVELVAEMRAEMPEEADVPTADVATNAVNVILGKRARATINTAQSAGDGSTASVTPPTQSKRSAWVTIGAFIVGLAGVVAAAVGVAAWLGWNPF